MGSIKILLGVMVGMVSGVLVGILFAPEKGSETRKKILKKLEDNADALEEKFNQFLDIPSIKSKRTAGEASVIVGNEKTKSEGNKNNVINAMESNDKKVIWTMQIW